MESDLLDALDQLGYDGPLSHEADVLEECEHGFSSPEYVSLLKWLWVQLAQCSETHTQATHITDPENIALLVSRLLKDLWCPFEGLATRLMNGEVKGARDHLKILLFLSSELQACQMMICKAKRREEELESPLQDLRLICQTLNLPDPSTYDTFREIESQIKSLLQRLPETHIGDPLLKSSLSNAEWRALERINSVLLSEYECRRRLLIKRLDVTVQSFSWSQRAKARVDRMASAYQSKRFSVRPQSTVCLAHLLSSRQDLAHVKKTSSGSSRQNTSCALNKVLMGSVPDRGGRPAEIQAPHPEMPIWKKRSEGGGRGSYRGGWQSHSHRGGEGWRSGRGGRYHR
ncbi:hypothetical protein DNTS_008909 [Danionella cerebrum]|uniref:Protein FAM98B n=1 Tax=Danionella cerebrum TaxID=2873325 RepID=A0A553NW91_9TELE|nr:hypothetical protein DNTS_008909 [Danionella translucida]